MSLRFSQVVHRIILRAEEEDAGGENGGVTTEHLLLAMLGIPEGDAWSVLSGAGLGEGLQAEMRRRLGILKPQTPFGDIRISVAVKRVLEASVELALGRKEAPIRSGHLLAALLDAPDDSAAALVLAAGVGKRQVLDVLDQPSTEA